MTTHHHAEDRHTVSPGGHAPGHSAMVAALYVDPQGVYSGLPDVDVWGEERDARTYAGPWPVVAQILVRRAEREGAAEAWR
jgi:hypothetical protein